MSADEGSISYGIVTLLIGVLLIFRFVFYYMIVLQFGDMFSFNKLNPGYAALVYLNFHGTVDILMGLFGFIGGGVLMAERGGAGGLFLVVWIYSLWTSIMDLIGMFTIAQFMSTIMTVIVINIIIIIIGAAILLIAIVRANE
ncbi:MAG: hypothetical protein ACTSO9_17930 [Candidatus Helarchaeota archaeon]